MFKTTLKLITLGFILVTFNRYFPSLIKRINSVSPSSQLASSPLIPSKTLEVVNQKGSYQDLELKVHQQVNQYRQSRNLPPLQLNSLISKQARLHSTNMATKTSSFSHNGFENRVKIISRQISYRSAAENLAYNQGYSDPVSVAVKGWIKSSGHHQNMIGNFNLTGIGIAKNNQGEYYFTQIFLLQP